MSESKQPTKAEALEALEEMQTDIDRLIGWPTKRDHGPWQTVRRFIEQAGSARSPQPLEINADEVIAWANGAERLTAEVERLKGLVAHLEEQVESQYDEAVTAKDSEVQR